MSPPINIGKQKIPNLETYFPDAAFACGGITSFLQEKMTCDFQNLYSGDEGYIVRCKQCGHYQVAFISTMLTLTENDFLFFCEQVHYKAQHAHEMGNNHSKMVMIGTPSTDVQLILTPIELIRLHKMVEQATDEITVQDMLMLFQKV
ncbi:MAG: hypothetical protein QM727_07190 [Niabella sp.]